MTLDERYQQGLAKLHEIAGDRQKSAIADWQDIVLRMQHYTVEFVAEDILFRLGLDPKTWQIATTAAITHQ